MFSNKPRGSSVIEILVSLSIGAVIIVVVGNVLLATHKLETFSKMRQESLAYAKEYLEIMNKISNQLFYSTSGCTPPSSAYTGCWPSTPPGYIGGGSITSTTQLYLVKVSGVWKLQNGVDTSNALFVDRYLNLEDKDGDSNMKKITVTVRWNERGVVEKLSLSTVLTAWQKYP